MKISISFLTCLIQIAIIYSKIRTVFTEAGADIYERLQSVLQGESFLTYIDTDVIYPEIRRNPSSV